MKCFTRLAAVLLTVALLIPTPSNGQDESGGKVSAQESGGDTTIGDIFQRQQDLLKKILKIQKNTLLLLEKSQDSTTQKGATKLLEKVSEVAKETEQVGKDVDKALKKGLGQRKKGLTVEYSNNEEDLW